MSGNNAEMAATITAVIAVERFAILEKYIRGVSPCLEYTCALI